MCILKTLIVPDRVVGSTEVDEEIPGPVTHLHQVLHGLQVGGQKACSSPDGGHSPGGDSHVWVLAGKLQHLPVQVIGSLYRREE